MLNINFLIYSVDIVFILMPTAMSSRVFSRLIFFDEESDTESDEQWHRCYNEEPLMWYPEVFWHVPYHIHPIRDDDHPRTPREFNMGLRQKALTLSRCSSLQFPGSKENMFWWGRYHDWFGDWLHLRSIEYLIVEENYHRTMVSFLKWKVRFGIDFKSYEYLYYTMDTTQ